jgi:hypothetical protein
MTHRFDGRALATPNKRHVLRRAENRSATNRGSSKIDSALGAVISGHMRACGESPGGEALRWRSGAGRRYALSISLRKLFILGANVICCKALLLSLDGGPTEEDGSNFPNPFKNSVEREMPGATMLGLNLRQEFKGRQPKPIVWEEDPRRRGGAIPKPPAPPSAAKRKPKQGPTDFCTAEALKLARRVTKLPRAYQSGKSRRCAGVNRHHDT